MKRAISAARTHRALGLCALLLSTACAARTAPPPREPISPTLVAWAQALRQVAEVREAYGKMAEAESSLVVALEGSGVDVAALLDALRRAAMPALRGCPGPAPPPAAAPLTLPELLAGERAEKVNPGEQTVRTYFALDRELAAAGQPAECPDPSDIRR